MKWSNLVATGLVRWSNPADQSWILRNLTTKGFLRAEAIAVRPEYIRGPEIRGIGFGEVVLSRVCWSSMDDTSLSYQGNIQHGVCAEHQFDITTVGRQEQQQWQQPHSDSTPWKDVSTEVAAEVARIWESKYGNGW